MNDHFKLSPDLPILSELPESLQEPFAAIRNEKIADEDVAKAIVRANRLAWVDSKDHANSSLTGLQGIHAVGSRIADAEATPDARSPIADAPPICIVVSPASPFASPASPQSLFGYLSQVGPLSYVMSALIMGFAVIIAWECKIADRLDHVEVALGGRTGALPLDMTAGHVSGLSECEWAQKPLDKRGKATSRVAELSAFAPVPVGRHVVIESGLLEITYKTGAKVILQGPAAFEVGVHGGYLRLGRLTGKLDAAAKAAAAQAASPTFAIRTPAAVVTDLGTEFAVQVEEDGRTMSHVFRGSVAVHPLLVADEEKALVLKKGESARTEPTNGQLPIEKYHDADVDRFVRRLPIDPASIRVYGTGLGVKDGCDDPRWQVVAVSNAPAFQARPATVATEILRTWATNIPGREKWLTPDRNCIQPVPKGTTYTFRTTFELDASRLDAAAIRGHVFSVGKVAALRLNGRDASDALGASPVKYSWEVGSLPQSLLIKRGLVGGENVLEIEVESGEQLPLPDPFSPVGLRVRLEGSYQDET